MSITPYPTLRLKITPPASLKLRITNASGAGATGPAGPAGPQGPIGPQGPAASLGPDLTAIEALTLTGVLCRTAADTWTLRTITGTANEITVADGGGVAANPTISLPSSLTFTGKTVTGGTFAGPAFSSFLDLVEIASPSNPAADHVKLFAKDVTGITHVFTRDSAGTEIDLSAAAVGGVTSLNGQTGALALTVRPQGRLTLQTAVPVMITTQSAKTTIYYTAYVGDMIPIYDGTNMVPTVITGGEISVATTDTAKNPAAIGASKVNDWFVWNDAGIIRLSHGPDWTNDTTRSAGTALARINGIWTNNVNITNGPAANRGTYVGTTRSNSSSQLDWILGGSASGGTAGLINVWNAYNRVKTSAISIDSGANYTYTSTTVRQARASAGNQVNFVLGLQEETVFATYGSSLSTVAALGAQGLWALGFDRTNNPDTPYALAISQAAQIQRLGGFTNGAWAAPIGYHFIAAVEAGDGTNANTFNFFGSSNPAKLTVEIFA